MSPEGRPVLILSNHFSDGHGGTPEAILSLARQLWRLGIVCDVACDRGLCLAIGMRNQLPVAEDDNAFQALGSVNSATYRAVFVAGSWNMRAPWVVLRAIFAGLPVIYAAKGCLSRIEFTRLRDMRRIPYLLLIEWWLILAARHIVFTSRAEQETYVVPSWLWRRKAALIPEPFEGGPVMTPMRNGRNIGFLAEISRRKGLLELIEGSGTFFAARPRSELRLKIAGAPRSGEQAYLARCKSLATRNGSERYIEWIGTLRGVTRDAFYSGVDLFICPSRFESFGLTVLEALWQGAAVCSGPSIGVLEFLDESAPILKLSSVQPSEIASALMSFEDAGFPVAQTTPSEGRTVLRRSNQDIGRAFIKLLSD